MSTFTPKLFTLLKNGYSQSDLRSDAIAGLTVAIIALPLAMALAIASGASPDKGLITAVIAGFLISFLGGSRVQVGGPTGAFVVVIFNVIAQHGYDGLILATLMAGVILLVAGYAKLGQIIKFIPHPVVTGFTAGIAVIIASSQVKDFLGLKIDNVPADFIPKWAAYFDAMDTVSFTTLGVGLAALLIIIVLRRFAPTLPGYLIAIVFSALVVAVFQIPVETIGSRFPDIQAGLPMPQLPAWDFAKLQSLIPSAFTIAFLAGIEALLSAVVADGMTGYKHHSNQELVGQGFANIASSLFGSLPATGAIARTATNIKAGAKTPMAGMFHALFLLLFMLFAMDVMTFVPMAALAAILFIVAWGMSEIGHFIHIFRLSRTDRAVMVLTFLLTVLVDLTVAIGVGVTLACLLFMKHMSEAVEIKSEWRKSNALYDEEAEYEAQRHDLPQGVEVFQITGPFFFGVASNLVDTLKAMGQMPKVLILRMRLVPYLDATGESALESVIKQCGNNGTQIILSGLQPQPMRMLKNAHIDEGKTHVSFVPNYESALKKAKDTLNESTLTITHGHTSREKTIKINS
ncbi:SulP family inorganic anion transporter [Legionella londiniensis]|uniref:Sulfate transporter n=1 Tax=Legionella londiniensis TaxID=45068 RepID=A0A0W0VMN6_9GAMM|nr:sulfate permease [Legionella londiniensis]KTD21352.1 sulfate transporter [Legionella londiniensis]STX93592.1 sulfate permease [Legionella londiniensis]